MAPSLFKSAAATAALSLAAWSAQAVELLVPAYFYPSFDPAQSQWDEMTAALAQGVSITAIMNVPVRHAGRRLGTLNFCGDEGTYHEREMAIGRVLAGLLAPALLKAVDG